MGLRRSREPFIHTFFIRQPQLSGAISSSRLHTQSADFSTTPCPLPTHHIHERGRSSRADLQAQSHGVAASVGSSRCGILKAMSTFSFPMKKHTTQSSSTQARTRGPCDLHDTTEPTRWDTCVEPSLSNAPTARKYSPLWSLERAQSCLVELEYRRGELEYRRGPVFLHRPPKKHDNFILIVAMHNHFQLLPRCRKARTPSGLDYRRRCGPLATRAIFQLKFSSQYSNKLAFHSSRSLDACIFQFETEALFGHLVVF